MICNAYIYLYVCVYVCVCVGSPLVQSIYSFPLFTHVKTNLLVDLAHFLYALDDGILKEIRMALTRFIFACAVYSLNIRWRL